MGGKRKVVDHVDVQAQVEKLTEEERDDLFTDLVMGKDVTQEVETSRGIFVIRYPKPGDSIAIERIEAARRNYMPIESFDKNSDMINTVISTLDILVVSGPKWFENAKKLIPKFSFQEVPSRALLYELYGKAISFREEIEQELNQTGKPAVKRVPPKKGDADPVDGGAFGDLTNEPGDEKA
jgi:hypothetical protein